MRRPLAWPLILPLGLTLALSCHRERMSECPAPFVALPSGTCIARPAVAVPDTHVVVFLHGMAPKAFFALENAVPLARAATARGIPVLAPLGQPGLCDWSDEVKQHFCWPTRVEHDEALAALSARLQRDLREANRLLDRPDDLPPVLVGFSNGGFAAARLATATDTSLHGLVILHAGSRFPMPRERAVPTLLRAATGDQWHHPTMIALRDQLAQAGWPAEWQEREGPHALTESDVEATLDFVARSHADAAPGLRPR